MSTDTIRDEMEEEDLICREEIKSVALEFQHHSDSKRFQNAVEAVLLASKMRQRDIFAKYYQTSQLG